MGAELFDWESKVAMSGQRNGSKVMGVGIGLSPVHRGIPRARRPPHRFARTASSTYTRASVTWGRTRSPIRHVRPPRSSATTGKTSSSSGVTRREASRARRCRRVLRRRHAHTRANHAAAVWMRFGKVQAIAAATMGGSPSAYTPDNGRVRGPGGSMTMAQIAERAIADGWRVRRARPSRGHPCADGSGRAAAWPGKGSWGSHATTTAERARSTRGSPASRSSSSMKRPVWSALKEYVGITDCGTVLHPRSLGAQVLGGSIQGMGMAMTQRWVFDPQYGVPFANRFYTARPPGMLDVPPDLKWGAVEHPRSAVSGRGQGYW